MIEKDRAPMVDALEARDLDVCNNHSINDKKMKEIECIPKRISLSEDIVFAVQDGNISQYDAELILYIHGDKEWPDPKPLVAIQNSMDYPIHAFPSEIRWAIEECVRLVQCPPAIAGASALGAVSTATQGLANIARSDQLIGPISLNLITLAESGERKTTVDTLLCNPIREWEKCKYKESIDNFSKYDAQYKIWSVKMHRLESDLKNGLKNNQGCEEIESAINNLIHDKPKKPVIIKLLFTDFSSEALASSLGLGHHSGALISSEGGTIFGGHSMNHDSIMRCLALLNTLWDGCALNIDRRNSESFRLQGARLTVSISVQPATFALFMKNSNGLVKGIGFSSRCLFSWPDSTQGTRFYREHSGKPEPLNKFYNRITELLNTPLNINKFGEISPKAISLSKEAKDAWIKFHDDIEKELVVGGEFEEIKDMASKASDNVARIAAQFTVYQSGIDGFVDTCNMDSAITIVRWYLHEYKRFLIQSALPERTRLAIKLKNWLVRYCLEEKNQVIAVRQIQSFGPYELRGADKLRNAVEVLFNNNYVFWENMHKKTKIRINPKIFK